MPSCSWHAESEWGVPWPSRSCTAGRSRASMRRESRSKFTLPVVCPRSTSSACLTPRCARRAIACARHCRTRSSSFRRARSRSTWRRRTCRKESGRFDLPIALGILAATGQIPVASRSRNTNSPASLRLTGELRPVRGALAMTRSARVATATRSCFLPHRRAEAALVRGATVYPARVAARGLRAPHGCARRCWRWRRSRAVIAAGELRSRRRARTGARRSERSKSPRPARIPC